MLVTAGAEAAMTFVHLAPLDLTGARLEGLAPAPFERGLTRGPGVLESPSIEASSPFDRLVGSWNAEGAASVEMSVQARIEGRWTPWYRLPRWQPGASRSFAAQEDRWGSVDVDVLKLARKADAFRYRVKVEGRSALLTRVAVSVTDSSAELEPEPPFEKGPWVRELRLGRRSQMEERSPLRRDICSPTALAMVLQYWGRKLKTLEVARAVQDHGRQDTYGNWTLNVAAAGAWGVSGQVQWLPSLRELESEIAAGRPVVVSLGFGPGELSGAPLRATPGHLVTVVGFSASGDVIAHDPAAPDRSSVRRVYRRDEFERAWRGRKGGLAYLLGSRFPEELAVGVPAAALRTRPEEPARPGPRDRSLSTQLLYGERVRALAARGDWVKVLALDQPRAEQGYPGWVRAETLRKPPAPYLPDSVVRAKRAEPRAPDAETLPLGSLLVSLSSSSARLADGRAVRLDPAHLRRLGEPPHRRQALETAALFLGDPYVWGGLSSLQSAPRGVDCSGLVHLAYRAVGLRVPRDARDQFRAARRISRSELEPADLVFLSAGRGRASEIDHVLLYTGGDGLIESRYAAGKTVRTTFAERFGRPLSALESGDAVTDLSAPVPFERRIFFGSLWPR